MTKIAKFRAPATLSNIGPGFDVLGIALKDPYDEVEVELLPKPGIQLKMIGPFSDAAPKDSTKNFACLSAQMVLDRFFSENGLKMTLYKGIPSGSGLGSSAASSVAGAMATLKALGETLSQEEVLKIVSKTEEMAAGSPHLDNVAPCLLGGLTMVLDQDNYLAKSIKVPENWYFAVILPRIEIKTSEARKVLPDKVPMADAIYNLRMISGLMDSVYNRDFVSFSGFLKDKIYSPYRAHLTPYVEDCKKLALEAGAYNLRVSGSGPAIFAPCKNQEICQKVLNQIKAHLENSKINSLGFLAKAYSMG